ncbi:hypothetical protein QTN25_007823 [Entamoeba marina]
MVLFFNRESCVKKDNIYKWSYRNIYVMDTDINFGFSFDDIFKVPKELVLVLFHAYEMNKITSDVDIEIAQVERENQKMLDRLKFGY